MRFEIWPRARLETSLYSFNTSSDRRMVIFLKTDRDSEVIVRCVIPAIASEHPSHHTPIYARVSQSFFRPSLNLHFY